MRTTCAPAQLPFAPRPLSTELFSSWLLRVAVANCVTLAELLDGLESRYPGATSRSLDLNLPSLFLQSISEFCRVPVDRIQPLDLSKRLPGLTTALLLRFRETFDCSPRNKWQRLGYAFCPSCITEQNIIHVSWDWCFACVTRCRIHRTPLQTGCPRCGESDPLSFGSSQDGPDLGCWSCSNNLSQRKIPHIARADEQTIRIVEEVYRASLLGVSSEPSLLGKVSHHSYRRFVDDMLQLLISYAHPESIPREVLQNHSMYPPRAHLFGLVAELISSAAPSSNVRCRRLRRARSLKLWTTILRLIPDAAGPSLEKTSQLWPVPMQRRFQSVLQIQRQRRWPYAPFQGRTVGPRFQCNDVFAVLDFRAVERPS
jgi:TniQ